MKLPFMDGFDIIKAGIKRQQEEHLYQLYVACYPHFTSENYMTFEDFKAETMSETAPKTQKSANSAGKILDNVQNILNKNFRKEKVDGY